MKKLNFRRNNYEPRTKLTQKKNIYHERFIDTATIIYDAFVDNTSYKKLGEGIYFPFIEHQFPLSTFL